MECGMCQSKKITVDCENEFPNVGDVEKFTCSDCGFWWKIEYTACFLGKEYIADGYEGDDISLTLSLINSREVGMNKHTPIYIISNRAGFIHICKMRGLNPNDRNQTRHVTRQDQLRGLDRKSIIIVGYMPCGISTSEIEDCGYRNTEWVDGTPFFASGEDNDQT